VHTEKTTNKLLNSGQKQMFHKNCLIAKMSSRIIRDDMQINRLQSYKPDQLLYS